MPDVFRCAKPRPEGRNNLLITRRQKEETEKIIPLCFSLDPDWLALKKFRDAKRSAAHITEAKWNQVLRDARRFFPKKPARPAREGLVVLGNISIPENAMG
ncbi:hypothetical protein HPB52_000777 [Rhipicephalus sanguineus]|uniref:Uncharacterized protein n=1 Tax=Rhipicephalus sanguineus TaxID=34632 RepID=A0A9D4SZD0_RHISA|nr:hypothetical protein HPB52_000777 [Rhipicephalus sanguineus]